MQPEQPPPGRSLEPLEARLRALPQPAPPADLEARLRAAIPTVLPAAPRPPRSVWPGLVGALAAACLLALLAWQGWHANNRKRDPATKNVAVQPVPADGADDATDQARWREARRDLDVEETPPFSWPLPEARSIRDVTALRAELLN